MLGLPERSARGSRSSLHDTEMGPLPHTVSTKNAGAYGDAGQVRPTQTRARNTLNALPLRFHAHAHAHAHAHSHALVCLARSLP